MTDCLHDGTYRLRNIGESPALNVWIVFANQDEEIPVGALDVHETRTLPPSVADTVRRVDRHITLARARADERPYTAAFDIWNEQSQSFTHGFRRVFAEDGQSVTRKGTVREYLDKEGVLMLGDIATFSA